MCVHTRYTAVEVTFIKGIYALTHSEVYMRLSKTDPAFHIFTEDIICTLLNLLRMYIYIYVCTTGIIRGTACESVQQFTAAVTCCIPHRMRVVEATAVVMHGLLCVHVGDRLWRLDWKRYMCVCVPSCIEMVIRYHQFSPTNSLLLLLFIFSFSCDTICFRQQNRSVVPSVGAFFFFLVTLHREVLYLYFSSSPQKSVRFLGFLFYLHIEFHLSIPQKISFRFLVANNIFIVFLSIPSFCFFCNHVVTVW